MSLNGRSIIVTGGASGLGEATARVLAKQGARVALLDTDETKGAAVAKDIGGIFVKTNVADEASVRAAIDAATAAHGPLFGLINCAGIARPALVVSKKGAVHSLDLFKKVIDVNLVGTFNVTRLAVAAMLAAPAPATPGADRGVVVNVGSIAALEGEPGQAAYSASKGGVVGMTVPLARELGRHGIRVMTVLPGVMATPMLQGNRSSDAVDAFAQRVVFPRRLGAPAEFGRLVLAIFENQYLNGECIRLDGGLRLSNL